MKCYDCHDECVHCSLLWISRSFIFSIVTCLELTSTCLDLACLRYDAAMICYDNEKSEMFASLDSH